MNNPNATSTHIHTDLLGTVHLHFAHLPLGNNFTYQHLTDAMQDDPHWDDIETYLSKHDLDTDVIITARLNFGLNLHEYTCLSDLNDHTTTQRGIL